MVDLIPPLDTSNTSTAPGDEAAIAGSWDGHVCGDVIGSSRHAFGCTRQADRPRGGFAGIADHRDPIFRTAEDQSLRFVGSYGHQPGIGNRAAQAHDGGHQKVGGGIHNVQNGSIAGSAGKQRV